MDTQSNSPGTFTFDNIDQLPLPELANALRAQADTITDNWMRQVRELVPHMKCEPAFDLKDSVPSILSSLADALGTTNPDARAGLIAR